MYERIHLHLTGMRGRHFSHSFGDIHCINLHSLELIRKEGESYGAQDNHIQAKPNASDLRKLSRYEWDLEIGMDLKRIFI